MIKIAIRTLIQADLPSVWYSVTSLYNFSWRSDIKSIDVFDEIHFNEISNDGYVTSFTITVSEPFSRYSFIMDNENLSGEWVGHFNQTERGTEVHFTESINLKKWWLYPFVWFYLRMRQKRYVIDLKRKCEQNG